MSQLTKEQVQDLAERIVQLRTFVNPIIVDVPLDHWKQLLDYLEDKHSTVMGASPIIDALGQNSVRKELEAKFRYKMTKAIYAYAKHLHEAREISKKLIDADEEFLKNKELVKEIFG